MTKQYEVIIVTSPGVDMDALEQSVFVAISGLEGVTLDSIEQTETFGMTGKDVVLSFVITVAAGVSVMVAENCVDKILRKQKFGMKQQVSVIELSTFGAIDDKPAEDKIESDVVNISKGGI